MSTSPTPEAVILGADTPATSRIDGVMIRDLVRHGDLRGGFVETYRESWHAGPPMVQGNRSDSVGGTVRGLHFHREQADYWVCVAGHIIACLHDLRIGSPTEGMTQGVELNGDTSRSLYIPPGVAHGFVATEQSSLTYLVDRYFDASDEYGIRYDDPQVGFPWPVDDPVLSDRDRTAPFIADLDPAVFVTYQR